MDSEQKKRLIFNGEPENFPVWWERFPDGENEPELQPLQSKSFVNCSNTTEDEARLDIRKSL